MIECKLCRRRRVIVGRIAGDPIWWCQNCDDPRGKSVTRVALPEEHTED